MILEAEIPSWLAALLTPVAPARGLAIAVTVALLVLALSRLGAGERVKPPSALR